MVDDVHRRDAALAVLERVDELAGVVQVGQRLSHLARQHVREVVLALTVPAADLFNSIQFNSMCKIPLSERSSTVKTNKNSSGDG